MPLGRVVVLSTSSGGDIIQQVQERKILDIFEAKRIAVERVNGADGAQKARREALFAAPGAVRAYPQVFIEDPLSRQPATCVGDFDAFQSCVDCAGLPDEMLSNPEVAAMTFDAVFCDVMPCGEPALLLRAIQRLCCASPLPPPPPVAGPGPRAIPDACVRALRGGSGRAGQLLPPDGRRLAAADALAGCRRDGRGPDGRYVHRMNLIIIECSGLADGSRRQPLSVQRAAHRERTHEPRPCRKYPSNLPKSRKISVKFR